MAYRAVQTPRKANGNNPGDPYCINCNKSGHWIVGCWSKGGGAEGKGPRQKRSQKKKKITNKDTRTKEKDKANQAICNDDSDNDNDSRASHASYMAAAPSTLSHSKFRWLLDGGATTHICHDHQSFSTLELKEGTIGSINKNGPRLCIVGRGTIHVICPVKGNKNQIIQLTNVAYCPDAQDNLVSESWLDRKGMDIRKWNGKVTIKKPNGNLLMQGELRGGIFTLYKLDCVVTPQSSIPTSDVAFSAYYGQSLDLWHRRFSHIHKDGLHYLVKHNLITGLDLLTNGSLGPCDGCAKGKHHQAPFPQKASHAANILDRLHMDLQGPLDTSIQGFRYTLGVVDDHSRMGWKRYLKQKSGAAEEIKALIIELETATERKVKIIRLDRGGEFIDSELQGWFKSKGITIEFLAPDTHQQNGVAERFNQMTHKHALSSLKDAGMSNGFWPEAHQYSNHVWNQSPTSALTRTTPYEVFYNTKPDVSTLRIFGSRCHVRIPKQNCKKLDDHSLDGILCGFAHRSKAYKVWIPSHHKFVTSRDVIVYKKLPEHEDDPIITSAPSKGVTQDKSASSEGFTKAPVVTEPPKDIAPVTEPENSSVIPSVSIPTPPALSQDTPIALPDPTLIPVQPRRSKRTVHPSWVKAANDALKAHDAEVKAANKAICDARASRKELKARAITDSEHQPPKELVTHDEITHLAYMAAHGPYTPLNYHDAIRSLNSGEWQKAMEEEFDLLTK